MSRRLIAALVLGLFVLILTAWYLPRLLVGGLLLLFLLPLFALFVPLRLQAEACYMGDEQRVRLRISWLYSALRFHLEWQPGSEAPPSLRLLGYELLEADQ